MLANFISFIFAKEPLHIFKFEIRVCVYPTCSYIQSNKLFNITPVVGPGGPVVYGGGGPVVTAGPVVGGGGPVVTGGPADK